jgi:hypothetical protein
VLLTNFPLFLTPRVMIAAMGVTQGAYARYAKCCSNVHRCTLRYNEYNWIESLWNQLLCHFPCHDTQRDRGAVTSIVRTPFPLTLYVLRTRLRPEGNCPDTAASRRHVCVQKVNALTLCVRSAYICRGNCVRRHGVLPSCVRTHAAMASCVRV